MRKQTGADWDCASVHADASYLAGVVFRFGGADLHLEY